MAGGFLTTKSPYSTKAGKQVLASSEQERKGKKERREEMVELKDCQQQETEGKVQLHSCLKSRLEKRAGVPREEG